MKKLLAVVLISFSALAQTPQVKTKLGLLSGEKIGTIQRFLGIPFAQPPVGDLRWKAPQPLSPWQGVKSCVAYGPSPMQAEPKPFQLSLIHISEPTRH